MIEKDNLYIVRSFGNDNKTILKFGFSDTIEKRIATYKSHNPNIEIVGTYYHKDGILFERMVHSRIKSEIGREWYSEDKLEELLSYIEYGFPPKYRPESLSRLNIALCKHQCFKIQKNKRIDNIGKIRFFKKLIMLFKSISRLDKIYRVKLKKHKKYAKK